MDVKKIKINELFSLKRGIVISKKYINAHHGKYPVYSSQTKDDGILGYIDTFMYDGEYITWTTDGVHAGTTFYRNGKFNCTNVCGIMVLNDNCHNIYLPYINCLLNLKEIAKSSGNKKVMSDDITRANLSISIPVLADGTFDLETQKELTEKYRAVEAQKKNLLSIKQSINKTYVDIPINSQYKEVVIGDIFSVDRGKSKYTKTFCRENDGEFPVYSANNEIPLAHRDDYDYDGKYLTISINGIAGVITVLEGKFSCNADRVVCTPLVKDINIEYIRFILQETLRNKAKGRIGELGKNEFTKLTPDMIKEVDIKVPITADDSFDYDMQSNIAAKYKIIESMKAKIAEDIKELVSLQVSII